MLGESTRMMLLVTNTFEKMGIPYAVGGSIASSLHGVMRSTIDVDIVADLRMDQIDSFIHELSGQFYADDEMIREAVERHSSFNLIHYETSYKVDVFIPKARNFDRKQLERRRITPVAEDAKQAVYLVSAEDAVLAKLEWYQMGGEVSDRQWRDILGVVKTKAGGLDLDYLRQMAMELKVTDLLERAISEV